MCGICGIVNNRSETPTQELLQTMARTMRHRGPDDEGFHVRPGLGLGFQRLSIIDLSGGHQPMASEDQRFHLVFNGEIYNYRQLRKQLEESRRHQFRTQSDTEVLLHLYQEYGEHCVRYLRGMFAFAVWDDAERTLFMARDHLGKKPLVYSELNGTLVFGSELKAILKYPGIARDIWPPAIDLYLSLQYVPSPFSIFKNIRKLPPAHTLLWKNGTIRIDRYWEPAFLPKTRLSRAEASEAMMEKLKESVNMRLVADVPLGAFLSGGKDSSLVVGLMSQLSPAPVKTFTLGFEGDPYSELPTARETARHFGCEHHEMIIKPDLADLLPKLAWYYGEPFGDSGAVSAYYVSQFARAHVTVALNGDGGDESFAGYPRYQAMAFLNQWGRLPAAARRLVFQMMQSFPDGPPPRSLVWRLKKLFRLGALDANQRYLESLCIFRKDQKGELYAESVRGFTPSDPAWDYLNAVLQKATCLRGVDTYLFADMTTYLPECLMTKMDIASMACGLEARSPMLDHEWIDLVASFPPSWKLRGGLQGKYLLTRAARKLLSKDLMDRPKQGFALPVSRWIRGPLRSYAKELLLSDRCVSRGLFHKKTLEKIFQEQDAGSTDRTYHLWSLIVLENWFRVYMDRKEL